MRSGKRFCKLATALLALSLIGCGTSRPSEPVMPEIEETAMPQSSAIAMAHPTESPTASEPDPKEDTEETTPMIYARVNDRTLSILPEQNTSAEAFTELLRSGDVTVDMHDYGSFEKVGALGTTLVRNDEQITTEPGDVILYQGNQITIYYDVNSWSFTRLGKVQNVTQAELREILGSGDVTVTFSLSAEPVS